MGKKIPTFSKLALSVFVVIFALSLISLSGTNGFLKPSVAEAAGPAVDNPGIQKAIEVQGRNSERLMGISGVVGHGIGISSDGEPIIKIFLERPGIPGIPVALEGIPTKVEVSGMFVAYADPKARFPRPVPIGVSTGHPDITAGTIGCRVKDAYGNVYALSNNHVYANSNDASLYDNVLQPGNIDGGTDPADAIGTLFDYETINFSGGNNTIDAAIALSSEVGCSTPAGDGYGKPSPNTVPAKLTDPPQLVQKYGRTTGWTHGQVSEINATVDVCYETRGPFRCVKLARFVGQIIITPGTFSDGGDSGSLIVTDDANKNPVGLLFAGSSTHTIANPIDLVLDRFQVYVDDSCQTSNYSPTADFTYTTTELTVDFTDQSTDSDGSVVSWAWDFGDGNTSTTQHPSHAYSEGGTYSVFLTVTDNEGATDTDSQSVTVFSGSGNTPPTADFSYTTTDLTADFTDQSTDSDGSLVSWAWDFGDGNTSATQNPSHTYAADGTYTVILTVTDNDSATDSESKEVTVSSGGSDGITLTATGYKVRGRHKADLEWSGATSTNVDIYRDGAYIATTENDGFYTDNIDRLGGGSYTYKVCEEGSNTTCSNEVTVIF